MNKENKPDCYKCKHRGEVAGSAHSKCKHPKCRSILRDPTLSLISKLGGVRGGFSPELTELRIRGNPMGINGGWFHFPFNFDPVWLEICDGYEKK